MKFKKLEKGQAMMVATMFFLTVSLVVIYGLAEPVINQERAVNNLFASRGSYFLAESGMEDVLYRLKNKISVSNSGQTTTLGGYSASTDITDTSGGKTIETTATFNGAVRKVTTTITTGVGVAFNYGIQVGQGGFTLSNNASVIGNVYSNGSISGSNGSSITGSAVAADTIALTADQSNLTPTTPPNSIKFRDTASTQDAAQSFQVSQTSQINKIQLYIKKVGAPANATVKIVNDSAGLPGNTVITSGTLSASLITTSYGTIDVTMSSNPLLVTGTTYWLVIDNGSQSASNYYVVGANSAYSSGAAYVGSYGGSMSAVTPAPQDMYFSIYLGGLTSSISGVTIGSSGVGDAWANSVTDSTVAGNLWCQSGSGNNKNCNTSKGDPTPQAWPVSDANITEWKSEATAGGVFNGNKTINTANTTLGPIEIDGNLTINANTTITGTVWVTGDISTSNGVVVKLDSSYGSNSGVLVADGDISLSNNVSFQGTGTSGSYIMLLSTNTSGSAISVANNAGAVILNAQNGTISFANNAGAAEATAYNISLSNNASIVYISGLASENFSSGPSGGWDVKTWREVQ